MKQTIATIIAIMLSGSVAMATPSTGLKTSEDKMSYALGVELGTSLKYKQLPVQNPAFMQGFKDGLYRTSYAMPVSEIQASLNQLKSNMKQAYLEKAKKNAANGAAFLAKNKTQPGVMVTSSGLQYKIITAGSGKSPTDNDVVNVTYRGTFINGTVFDSTERNGNRPISFKPAEVIPGWTEALKMMKPGAHWIIAVPSTLAYGERGMGGAIGPNETLIFDLTLVSIGKAQ